jgi:hypothetical protein
MAADTPAEPAIFPQSRAGFDQSLDPKSTFPSGL